MNEVNMHAPINLTPAALLHIKQKLAREPGSIGFRLTVKKTGCSGYAYVSKIISQAEKDDLQYLVDGMLIFIDAKVQDILKNITVDFIQEEGQGLKQKRLVFINPKEAGRCGCGESFTIE
jgi:iron-sulfur cluster assembly accessory protein